MISRFEAVGMTICRSFRATLLAMAAIACALCAPITHAEWTKVPAAPVGTPVPYDSTGGRVLLSVGRPFTSSFYASFDNGSTWQERAVGNRFWRLWSRPSPDGSPRLAGDLYATFIVGGDPFGLFQCELRKTSDIGLSWTVVAPASPACNITFDPSSPDVMYATGQGEMGPTWFARTLDGGRTWVNVNSAPPLWVYTVRVAPDGTVYTLRSELYASRDRGDTWIKLPLADYPGVFITDLRAGRDSQSGANVVVATTNSGLFRSSDGGMTWSPAGLQGYEVISVNTAIDTADMPRVVGFRGGVAWWADKSVRYLLRGLSYVDEGWLVGGDGHYVTNSTGTFFCADLSTCIGGETTTTALLIEYRDALRDHYFLTLEGAEAAAIDRGDFGPWARTGEAFRVYPDARGRSSTIASSCRFYGTPGTGPNSHFYTLATAECSLVQRDAGWMLETKTAFAATSTVPLPIDGTNRVRYGCKSGREVYRLYNNRFAQNDSNHRYVADVALLSVMQSRGWVVEGVQFCEAP